MPGLRDGVGPRAKGWGSHLELGCGDRTLQQLPPRRFRLRPTFSAAAAAAATAAATAAFLSRGNLQRVVLTLCVDAVPILQMQTHDGQGREVRVQLDLVRVGVRDRVRVRALSFA